MTQSPATAQLAQQPRGRVAPGSSVGGGAVEDDRVLGAGRSRTATRSRVTPSAAGSTRATTTSSPSSAGTSSAAAPSAYVTPTLRPVTRPSSIVVGGRSGMPAPTSRTAGVSMTSPVAIPGSNGFCCSSLPAAASVSAPQQSVSHTGSCTARRAGLAEQHRDLGQPEPLAAVRLGHGERQQAGLGERGPVGVPVERLADHRAHGLARLIGRVGTHARLLDGSVRWRQDPNCNLF